MRCVRSWTSGRAAGSFLTTAATSAPLPPSTSPPERPEGSTLVLFIAAGLVLALGSVWWVAARTRDAWRNPLDNAQFKKLTDFGGAEQAAAISRDGRLVAFASDHDGQMDVWVTQIGTGQFHNLTQGRVAGAFVNPVLRTLAFTPDGAFVTMWVSRQAEGQTKARIDVWGIPTLGGEPRVYLEGKPEFDWSADGSRLLYHVPADGDPTFVRGAFEPDPGRQIYVAPDKFHAHFPLWSPKGDFAYFVRGAMLQQVFVDAADIWRLKPDGSALEQITRHDTYVSYPVFLDDHTLAYLAKDPDGSGPWLYSLDVDRRVPHRVTTGLDRYSSLAASADGRRLVATLSNPKTTLWRLRVGKEPATAASATPLSLTTGAGSAPRLGPDYMLYVTSNGAAEGIWKVAGGAPVALWNPPDARVIGGPEIAPDGRAIAFSVDQRGRKRLYVMNSDGTNARVVTDALELRGAPSWTRDGQAITSAADVNGSPRLFRIALNGERTMIGTDYALDPAWSPRDDYLVYSGPDIGTTFEVKAVTAAGSPHALPRLTLTRGARRLRFLSGQRALVVMEGDIRHKDIWRIDLETGVRRQLTSLPPEFTIRDFDISSDGTEVCTRTRRGALRHRAD